MSIANDQRQRAAWQRRATMLLRGLDDLGMEIDVAQRARPRLDQQVLLAEADADLEYAQRHIQAALARIARIQ